MVHEKAGSEKKSKFENKLLQTAFSISDTTLTPYSSPKAVL